MSATLNRRQVEIVDGLSAADQARAYDCARLFHDRGRGFRMTDDDRHQGRGAEVGPGTQGAFDAHLIGAQGEIVVARILGVEAPLDPSGFQNRPDIPPDWSVKTQQSTSKDMLDGYLRLTARSFHRGWRHVLVERDQALDGRLVFIVHGWVSDQKAREVGRRRYAYSSNQFVHLRHLEPIEPLSQLDGDYWAERADRWHFDADGELRMRSERADRWYFDGRGQLRKRGEAEVGDLAARFAAARARLNGRRGVA